MKEPDKTGATGAMHHPEQEAQLTGLPLQSKVALLILALFAFLMALSVGIGHHFIMPSFLHLERQEAEQHRERVLQMLDREAEHLVVTASDWGTWTATWLFLQDRNTTYVEENLTMDALLALRADMLYIYDSTGVPVWGMAIDRAAEERRPLPELDGRPLPAGHPLRSSGRMDQSPKGLLMTEGGPVLVGARPITTSEGTGPVMGMVLFGRFLDTLSVAALAAQACLDLRLLPVEVEGDRMKGAPVPGDDFIQSEGALTTVRHLLRDVEGRPVQELRIRLPRTILEQGQRATRIALAMLSLAGILVLGALLAALRRMVLEPTRRLTEHADRISRSGVPSPAFDRERRDELGLLARRLDEMVIQLGEARRQLLDQSFRAGRSEMAAGILHNIGNALTPLTVKADQLQRDIQSAPVADLDLALGELAGGGLDESRRADLQAYALLAQQELRQVLERARGSAAAVTELVGHVNQILTRQESHSRSGQVRETVELETLLTDTAALLDPALSRRMEIQLDPSVRITGSAPVARVILQQILSNLMINAAEAVVRADRDRGNLWISARRGEAGRLELLLRDDGVGIETGLLDLIFGRGFSTKAARAGTGLGLHWCANTLGAMGGWIRAESAGAGAGASFRISLPWEDDQHVTAIHQPAQVSA
ncbi:MAG: CHASE4 domain-containing protein [bacterium]|nr:CHASE4 domain-containing protein [bacterium]